ncbi:probable U3 small nucleolar RNA-associated 11 [Olea europaea subsp. europaea]|uniref:Probable U3 small nucleolar RNA-associated 11 n=1 Tax=Olea europaea subsp. europaea TaxID=158383 RepID=A0A8S0R2C6_OLEEU|nr:probable U3 small nucleolar RNA-associated 11 [Olea europaea subsp. europaea]
MSSIRKQIHKDYIERARAYHQKKQALRKLKLKAALRDPDEFYLKRIKTKKFGVFYKLKRRANKYLKDDLKYILLKKKIREIDADIEASKSRVKELWKLLENHLQKENATVENPNQFVDDGVLAENQVMGGS